MKAALAEALALFLADLDVGRREQINTIGDAFHPAAETIGKATCEIDQTPPKISFDLLEVEDHRLIGLETIG